MGCKSGETEELAVETARREVFSSIFQLDFILMLLGLESANVTQCSILPLYVSGCCCYFTIYLCGRGGNGVGFI
jgi:hypothetical protein